MNYIFSKQSYKEIVKNQQTHLLSYLCSVSYPNEIWRNQFLTGIIFMSYKEMTKCLYSGLICYGLHWKIHIFSFWGYFHGHS